MPPIAPRLPAGLERRFGETGVYAAALPGNGRYAVGIADGRGDAPRAPERPDGLDRLAERTRAYVARACPVSIRSTWDRVPAG